MRVSLRLAAMLFAMLPLCDAAETCPWLNSATAGGIIGTPLVMSVSRSQEGSDDASCTYQRSTPHGDTVMTIEVQTMEDAAKDFRKYRAKCGAGAAPVRAIGNEAVSCSGEGKTAKLSEQVIGRVRNQAFVVRISSSDPALLRPALREQARTVAEHVAGILF